MPTLTGKYRLIDGTAAVGTVVVIPSEAQIVDSDGNVILAGRVSVALDSTGSFSVDLPATDDADLAPTGFGYTLSAKLNHTHLPAISFQLPAATPTVDVADLTLVDPTVFSPTIDYASQDELDAVIAAATAEATARASADTTEATARAAADTALDGRLDVLEGQTLDTRLDTLEGQTLDTRLDAAETSVTDHETRIDELEAHIPGVELGYAERASNFTTTNTSSSSVAAGSKVTSLLVTVTGQGRPVDVEFYSPSIHHSTAAQVITVYLVVNGVAQSTTLGQSAFISSPVNTLGRAVILKRRLVLTEAVEYTFEVGLAGASAGTVTLTASAAVPSSLSVTSR